MRPPFRALARTAAPAAHVRASAATPGVSVDAAALAALEVTAREFHFLPRQPVHSVLAGRHASRVRGRGLTFEELRLYLPGDDIRSMDWRVTARTGKPHVRVYTEEKDRPVLLVVDQRINMFFGSRRAMKSVAAAEAAALVAWRVLAEGDRIGGVVVGDAGSETFIPRHSRQAVQKLLGGIARFNRGLRADAPARRAAGQLNAALEHAAREARHDCLVIVISDFDGHDARTRALMLALGARNDVLTMLVHDPFLSELPESGQLVVSDGELQVELGFGQAAVRRSIAEFADAHGKALLDWHHAMGVPLLPLSAAEDTALQLRRLLGSPLQQAPVRRRGGVAR
ncbi:DUF58 domain-containing protein [Cupriavidus necator]|uniref:DUF58 domain-containing protein n=1 Tax=Cupriavidus necator TaxID=106590 RepID=UPI00339D63CC